MLVNFTQHNETYMGRGLSYLIFEILYYFKSFLVSLSVYRKRSLNPLLSVGLQGSRRFQSSTVNYSTLLLDADRERLYVGARGAVFALDATDISASPAASVSTIVAACRAPRRPRFFISVTSWFALHNAGIFLGERRVLSSFFI